jgi:hypothetical protein
MVSGSGWQMLGIQRLNHLEHATQVIAETTSLLEFDTNKCNKLPAQSLDAFLNSIVSFTKKTRTAIRLGNPEEIE